MSTTEDFLFELGCEELPPKELATLGRTFCDHIKAQLTELDIPFAEAHWFASPRRLAIIISQLTATQPDKVIERRGPAVKAAFDADNQPTKAALGFAKSCGTTIEQLKTISIGSNSWLGFDLQEKGKSTTELLPLILEKAIVALPIAKRMRWGKASSSFVRPVHWVVALWGEAVLPMTLFELKASNQTHGHRVHSTGPITINHPKTYASTLEEQGKVIVDFEARKAMILQQVTALGEGINAKPIICEDLLNEVTALNEWPKAMIGRFDAEFLKVPQEALTSSMQEHQKYFPLQNTEGQLLPNFITVTNIESRDAQQVISGNEKVIRPRLADAQFFYQQDLKTPMESFNDQLKNVTFQHKLGSVYDKVSRVVSLSRWIADQLGIDSDAAGQAAQLIKADLATQMVGEFPELQGIMGHYYAKAAGHSDEVAKALEEQYLPRFAGDHLPTTDAGMVVSIADKIDTLVGIFGINQPPSGVKDPFALRRASLGVLRIIIDKGLNLDLSAVIKTSIATYPATVLENPELEAALFDFIFSRYRTYYQSQSIPTDVIQSVEALRPTKPYDFDRRIEAVNLFRHQPEAQSLSAANKRVHNILKKAGTLETKEVKTSLLQEPAEKMLHQQLLSAEEKLGSLIASYQYTEVLNALVILKQPVDQFFDEVMVNVEDPALQQNRLALLKQLRALFLPIADISFLKID